METYTEEQELLHEAIYQSEEQDAVKQIASILTFPNHIFPTHKQYSDYLDDGQWHWQNFN